MSNKPKMVIHHKNCDDGLCAACVLAKKFNNEYTQNKIEFVEGEYDREPHYLQSYDYKDKDVFIVDFGFTPETLHKIAKEANSVTMLDHHATMWDYYKKYNTGNNERLMDLQVSTNCQVKIDLDKSGALLAWDHFFKIPAPALVKAISDGDLFRFEDENTRPFLSYLLTKENSMDSWLQVMNMGKQEEAQFLSMGDLLVKQYDGICNTVLKNVQPLTLLLKDDSGKILQEHHGSFVVCSGQITSRVGELMYLENKTFAAMLSKYDGEYYGISLRSSNKQDPIYSVKQIAEFFGGGGHETAAAFRIHKSKLDEILKIGNKQELIIPNSAQKTMMANK